MELVEKGGGIRAISLPDARQLSDEVLQALRLRALRGIEPGLTETAVADLLGVAHETVCRWWTADAAEGLDALPGPRSGRPSGSGRFLSDSQARHLPAGLDRWSPAALGIAAPLWTRRAVRDLIPDEFGISLAERTVGADLRRWGYTPKAPGRPARKQDPAAVREWWDLTDPTLEERATRAGAAIVWGEERGVAADEHPARGSARRGQPAPREGPRPPLRRNQISAISNEGAVRFMTYAGAMNAAWFLRFWGRLLRSTTGKIILIADRLKAQEEDTVEEWLAAHRDRWELVGLPRSAPELNPEEYLNQDVKGGVNAEGLPDQKRELRSHIQRFMRRWLHLPEQVSNYFQHPCVQYAAGT
jgi:transposase